MFEWLKNYWYNQPQEVAQATSSEVGQKVAQAASEADQESVPFIQDLYDPSRIAPFRTIGIVGKATSATPATAPATSSEVGQEVDPNAAAPPVAASQEDRFEVKPSVGTWLAPLSQANQEENVPGEEAQPTSSETDVATEPAKDAPATETESPAAASEATPSEVEAASEPTPAAASEATPSEADQEVGHGTSSEADQKVAQATSSEIDQEVAQPRKQRHQQQIKKRRKQRHQKQTKKQPTSSEADPEVGQAASSEAGPEVGHATSSEADQEVGHATSSEADQEVAQATTKPVEESQGFQASFFLAMAFVIIMRL
jgi:hypothetical protein